MVRSARQRDLHRRRYHRYLGSESSRNAAGTMSGKVAGAGFQVVAKGPTFTANLNLVTRGDKQSVTIKSPDAKADVQGATITLQRG